MFIIKSVLVLLDGLSLRFFTGRYQRLSSAALSTDVVVSEFVTTLPMLFLELVCQVLPFSFTFS